MGGGIPPVVQMVQMSDLRSVDSREGERESKPLEIHLNGFERWVLLPKLQRRRELGLNGCPKWDRDRGCTNLRALRVERSAKTLKVCAEQHDVASKTLLGKQRMGRGKDRDGGAVGVKLAEA